MVHHSGLALVGGGPQRAAHRTGAQAAAEQALGRRPCTAAAAQQQRRFGIGWSDEAVVRCSRLQLGRPEAAAPALGALLTAVESLAAAQLQAYVVSSLYRGHGSFSVSRASAQAPLLLLAFAARRSPLARCS